MVQLARPVGDAPRGALGMVVAVGPEHALVRLARWGTRDVIVPLGDLKPARTLVGLPLPSGEPESSRAWR